MKNGQLNRREFISISSAFLAGSAVAAKGLTSPGDVNAADSKGEVKEVHSVCEMCFWRCGITASVQDGKIIKINGQKNSPLSNGKLCPRGTGGAGLAHDPDRLTTPLIRNEDGKSFRKASWDEATTYIAEKLNKIREESGTESIVEFSHGFGASFFKHLFHSYGVETFSHPSYAQCRGPRTAAYLATYGTAPTGLESYDVKNAKYLMLIGTHIGENMHNTLVQEFSHAVANGCKVVAVDPRYSTAAGKGTWIPVKPGTDIAFLRGVIHVMLKEKLYDEQFIKDNATGLDELWEGVKSATPENTFALSGVPAETVIEAARDFGRYKNNAMIHPGRHVTWYGDDTQRQRCVAIINALTGNWMKPGGFHHKKKYGVPGTAKVKYPHIAHNKFKSQYPLAGRDVPSNEVIEQVLSGKPYDIRAFFIYGTNLIHTLAQQEKTIEALKKLDLVVAVDVLPMEICSYADVVLPEASYLERYDDLDDKLYKVPHVSIRQPVVAPPGDAKPGHEIARLLADKMGVKDLYEQKYGKDIETYLDTRLKKIGKSLAELKEVGTFAKAPLDLYREDGEILKFKTPSKKIELASSKVAKAGGDAVPQFTPPDENPPGFFRLIYGRAPMHTFGRTANNRLLGELMPENELWVNEIAAEDMKLKHGEYVYLVNQDGVKSKTPVKVRRTQRIRPECVYMVHGFGHTDEGLKFAKGRGASDADLMTKVKIDPLMGGTGFRVNFVTFTREA